MSHNESRVYWLGYYQTHKPELAELVLSLSHLKLALDKGFEPNVSPQAIKYELDHGCYLAKFKLHSYLMYFLQTNQPTRAY